MKRGRRRAGKPAASGDPDALANDLCPHKSNGVTEAELVPSAGRGLTAGQVMALAIDRVTAVVAKTTAWGRPITDWHVGDYRFLVLSFTVRKDVGFYVQLWTEPEEPVLVEACSGAWNPPARPYVGAPQRAALRRMGYRVGGRARNYQKHWTMSPLADPRALAQELLAILVDVFGYRADRPLKVSYCAEGRTASASVFPALAFDDAKRMLGIGGCRVAPPDAVGPVPPRLRGRMIHVDLPFPFVTELRGQSGRTPAWFDAIRFITVLPGSRGLSGEHVESLARECSFGRFFRDADGDVLLIQDLVVAGTTVRWFLMTLRTWMHTRDRAIAMLRLMLAAPAPAEVGADRSQDGGLASDDADFDPDNDDSCEGEPRRTRTLRTVVH
jgi:hypothetical protein